MNFKPIAVLTAALILPLWSVSGVAELAPEQGKTTTLPKTPNPHWVFVNDIVFNHMEAGRATLVDGDKGTMIGMVSTGFQWLSMVIPKDWSALYAIESHLSRTTRGKRTDVVVIYDPTTLAPIEEIVIPPKHMEGMPTLYHAHLSDDETLLYVYNFTPAQSVTVVDLRTKKFVGEIETPGCAFIYPTGNRRFNMLCGDASMLAVTVDDSGKLLEKSRSKPFFEIQDNFVTEKAVRHGDTYMYITNQSEVVPVQARGEEIIFGQRWSLTNAEEKAEGWRIGGIQHTAIHHQSERMYVLMHRGGDDSHKDPGEEVWVFDLRTGWKIARIPLQGIATAIQVSQDSEPLLFTAFVAEPRLHIYDAVSGEYQNTVEEIGLTPTVLQTPAPQ